MTSVRDHLDLERIAACVVESQEALLKVMEDAAKQLSCENALEDIDVAGFPLYLAKSQECYQKRAQAVVCAMDYEEYLRLLNRIASKNGLCLDESSKLEVSLPEMEFGEDLVTGGFENFKGIYVEPRNDCLIELMEAVSTLLEKRGLAVTCIPDEDVIFYLPIR